MAEVLVTTQTIPIMNLHPADGYHGRSASQSHHSSSRSTGQVPRTYGSHNVGVPYRAPVAPYAFQSTPNLKPDARQNLNPGPLNNRPSTNPSSVPNHRANHAPSSSASSASTNSNSASNTSSNVGPYTIAKDDSILTGKLSGRPESTFLTSSSTPDLSLISFNDTPKASPDRYRRTVKRVDSSSSTGGTQANNGNQRFSQQWPTPQAAYQASNPTFKGPAVHTRSESADDASKQAGSTRYRRRSVSALEQTNAPRPGPAPTSTAAPTWSQVVARGHSGAAGPVMTTSGSRTQVHSRNNSAGSQSSAESSTLRRPVSSRQDSYGSNKSSSSNRPNTAPAIAPRGSPTRAAAEMSKRVTTPSPLSKPVASETEKRPMNVTPQAPASPQVRSTTATTPSPAVQQLNALSNQDPNKGMKSRLRRAFSFGSAQELRKASAQNNANKALKEQTSPDEELQGEDAAVAAQQEAAGIGAGIYSGQGGVYGSTDNLSISSTASSASIMLRKMGRGMKKSTKSIRGLFRPKSIIGDPVADSAVTASAAAEAEVSLVNVEAEREKVNVNKDPHDRPGGGTGYPKLEQNSIDTSFERPSSSRHGQNDSVSSRKSIIGGDRERQEALAAVKKGILKRNNTSSPVHMEPNPSDLNASSLPSTPETSNPAVDFFLNSPFGNTSTRSLPRDGPMRNISWNPKVQFFDVWASNEYDRRGDIATCNRLTPMLAQQIKEELNSFKMEMEVHEMSKPHTHFF